MNAADSRSYFWFLLLSVILIAVFTLAPMMAVTGDEVRYLMYSYAFATAHTFQMTLEDWSRLYVAATGGPSTDLPGTGLPGHPVYLAVILSPIAYVFSIAGLRWVALFCGLAGLYGLMLLCRRAASPTPAMIALTFGALSIPLLPYLHLFYMEVFVFALVSIGWAMVAQARKALEPFAAVAILAIPFIHLRGAVVAVVLYAILLLNIFLRERLTIRLFVFIVTALIALCLLIAANLAIYGTISGSVNTALPAILLDNPFWVIATQLAGFRHGLFIYSPIWMLGIAGLLLGCLRKHTIAIQGAVLLLVAILTGLGPDPGECWPSRFFVLGVPMLSVGLAVWFDVAKRSVTQIAIVAALALPTIANSLLFVVQPNKFLENRHAFVTYGYIRDLLGFHSDGSLEWNDGSPLPAKLAPLSLVCIIMLVVLARQSLHRQSVGVDQQPPSW